MRANALAVMAKAPKAGQVKTRLLPALRLICQEGDDLGERMKRLFEHLRALGHKNIVLIGSDLPALPCLFFDEAYAYLQSPTARAVLGPSRDGGYYLIGLNQSVPEIFEAMAWSHDQVLEQTRVKLASLRIDTLLLPLWFDIDTPDDLRRLKSQFDLNASLAKRMKYTAALLSGWELSGRQDRA